MSPVTKRHQSQHVFAAEDADDDILSHLQSNNVPGPVQGGEGGWKSVFYIQLQQICNFLCQGCGTLTVKSLPDLHVSSSPSSSYKAITWYSIGFLGLLWWFVTATESNICTKVQEKSINYIAKIKLEQILSYVVCATGLGVWNSTSSGCCGLLHSLYTWDWIFGISNRAF